MVVLIARKMPRLAELFRLSFGDRALVLSDLAIPFAHRFIAQQRVAIVDDVVNVGSTLQHAHDCVKACGAATIRLFALGTKNREKSENTPIEYSRFEPLSEKAYDDLVTEVPAAIRQLAKPYDLEFPIIHCRLAAPARSAYTLLEWLRDRYGPALVHDLTCRFDTSGLSRFTLDKHGSDEGNVKLRLYVDERQMACNLVPFAIPPNLQREIAIHSDRARSLLHVLEEALTSSPTKASLWPDEARCRARLFCRSLDLGLAALDDLGEVLVLDSAHAYSLHDAELLFGPVIRSVDRHPVPTVRPDAPLAQTQATTVPGSPFLNKSREFAGGMFLERIRTAAGSTDAVSLFACIFDVVAELVGASDANKYSLDWPFSKEEVRKHRYLRLRVGPTFEDLVQIMGKLDAKAPHGALPLRNLVSMLLDFAIDAGAVVPTTAKYGDWLFRIYRKGETPLRDLATNRVLYAWRNYGKPMSLTRFSKLNTILAYSSELPQVMLPQALLRGNVASLQSTCVDEMGGAELSHYLRDTGRLESVSGGTNGD